MEQTHIYEYLGVDTDPIFNIINSLQEGQAVDLGMITLSLNYQGLYELETIYHHECFNSKKQIYEGIAKYFSSLII